MAPSATLTLQMAAETI